MLKNLRKSLLYPFIRGIVNLPTATVHLRTDAKGKLVFTHLLYSDTIITTNYTEGCEVYACLKKVQASLLAGLGVHTFYARDLAMIREVFENKEDKELLVYTGTGFAIINFLFGKSKELK